jgi:hypothetical protein
MNAGRFVDVDVEPGLAAEDGLQQRWRRCEGGSAREVAHVVYEADNGLAGRWRAEAVDDEAGEGTSARAYEVEDSSAGSSWLVVGGKHGLRLTHEASGATIHEPYLLLASSANLL